MATERIYVNGVVKNGVIIPEEGVMLEEGAQVEILTSPVPTELQEELDAWDAASDEDMAALDRAIKDMP